MIFMIVDLSKIASNTKEWSEMQAKKAKNKNKSDRDTWTKAAVLMGSTTTKIWLYIW